MKIIEEIMKGMRIQEKISRKCSQFKMRKNIKLITQK